LGIILADSLRGVSTSRQLKRDGGGFAATDAQRRRTALQPVFLQRREQGHDDSGARCADWMAERTSAAMHIDFFMRQIEFPHRRHGDNREGLVDLERSTSARDQPVCPSAFATHQWGGGELAWCLRMGGMGPYRRQRSNARASASERRMRRSAAAPSEIELELAAVTVPPP